MVIFISSGTLHTGNILPKVFWILFLFYHIKTCSPESKLAQLALFFNNFDILFIFDLT